MRTNFSISLHAALAAALIVFAASSAAAVDRLKLLATVNMGATDAQRGRGDKWIEIQGWDWGRAAADDHEQEMTVGAGAAPPPPGNVAKFGAVSGVRRNDGIAAPAEKRQHDWRPSPMALERGAVRIKVKFPWVDCRTGARFPGAVLESPNGIHELSDVTVTGCTADSIALHYAKVKVRAWDPVKKQEVVGRAP